MQKFRVQQGLFSSAPITVRGSLASHFTVYYTFDVVLCGQDGAGQWLSMDSEIIMKNGEPIGTQGPTGHYVLLDAHFELPSGITTRADAPDVCTCRAACGQGRVKLIQGYIQS